MKQFIDLCNNLGFVSPASTPSCPTAPQRRTVTSRTALKFLYARKFDVPRAVALYEQHQQIRLREGLYHIDPFLEPLHAELQTGKFTILVSSRNSYRTRRTEALMFSHFCIAANPGCEWGRHCPLHRQQALPAQCHAHHYPARHCLSAGQCASGRRHAEGGTHFHLRHERLQVLEFWLWFVTEDLNAAQGKFRIDDDLILKAMRIGDHFSK